MKDKVDAEKDRLLEIRKRHIEYLQNLILEINKGKHSVVFIKYTNEQALILEENKKEGLQR